MTRIRPEKWGWALSRPWYARGWQFRPTDHSAHSFSRLGAFIDGVYAIAATLLVLELRLPESVEPGQLGHQLAELGPEYAAYAIGFLQMVGGWLQSRRLDAWLVGVDHYTTLLMVGSVAVFALTPFTTEVLARSFADERDVAIAVRLSAGLLFVATIFWALTLNYARRAGLVREDVDPDAITLYFRLNALAWLGPLLAWLVSYVASWAALAILVALYLLSLLPLEAHPDVRVASAPTPAPARPPAPGAPTTSRPRRRRPR